MENQLLDQGITLMLAGMGTVFAFLTALVVAMTLMSKAVTRFQSNATSIELTQKEAIATNEEVAAISAAIIRHRNK